jgi:hypothetical protein
MEETQAFKNHKQVPQTGNFMFIIKPGDTTILEGKALTELPTLDMLVFGVAGHIELVPFFNKFGGRPCVAFCNENGKNEGLPSNEFAQMLWEESVGRIIREDHLVGQIVVIVGSPSFLQQL